MSAPPLSLAHGCAQGGTIRLAPERWAEFVCAWEACSKPPYETIQRARRVGRFKYTDAYGRTAIFVRDAVTP